MRRAVSSLIACAVLTAGCVASAGAFASGSGTCEIEPDFSTITAMGSRTLNQNPGPFLLETDVSTYGPNDPIQVTLSGAAHTGVVVTAVDAAGTHVGTWTPDGTTSITGPWSLDCDGAAITHTTGYGTQTSHTFAFTAPASSAGPIYFEAYVLSGSRGDPEGQAFHRFVRDDATAPAIVSAGVDSVRAPAMGPALAAVLGVLMTSLGAAGVRRRRL